MGNGRYSLERQPPSLPTLLSTNTHAQVKVSRPCLRPTSLWQGKEPCALGLTLIVFLFPVCPPRAFH